MSILPDEYKRNGAGSFRTKSLFYETTNEEDKYYAFFTLQDDDLKVGKKVYPSVRKLYLAIADPTEYYFAIELFGTWEHWEHIASTAWMSKKLNVYRRELEVMLKAVSVKSLMKASTRDNSVGISASKYLIDKGWSALASKASTFKPASVKAISKEVEDDLKRMGIS